MQHLHKAVQITLRDEEEAVAQRNLDPVAMAMDPSYLFRSVVSNPLFPAHDLI